MSESISILVTRPAPFWLPAAFRRDDDGRKVAIAPPVLLRPGANTVRQKRWDLALQHPTVAAHLEHGTLRLDASPAEVAAHTHAPDPLSGLSDLSITKAAAWISASDSTDTLAAWRTGEVKGKNRAGMIELLDARLEELLEAAEK